MRGLCFVLLLVFLMQLSAAMQGGTRGIHRKIWDSIFLGSESFTELSMQVDDETANMQASGDLQAPHMIDFSTGHRSNAAQVPVGVSPLCLAYNFGSPLGLSLSCEELFELLVGNATSLSAAHPTLRLGLALNCTLLDHLEQSGVLSGACRAPPDNFADRVAANPRVTSLSSVNASVDFAKANSPVITILPYAEAAINRLSCARIRVDHPQYPGLKVNATAAVPEHSMLRTKDNYYVYPIASEEPIYPFMIPVVIFVKSTCIPGVVNRWDRLLQWVGEFEKQLALWQISPFPKTVTNGEAAVIAGKHADDGCPSVSVVRSSGSSVAFGVLSDFSLKFLGVSSSPTLLSYTSLSSESGLSVAKSDEGTLGTSDLPFTEKDFTDYPNVQFVPFAAFAVSIIYNLPGSTTSLVIPRCTALMIFAGYITRWNSQELQEANPTLTLPDMPIRLVVRGRVSGTTFAFTQGLAEIEARCVANSDQVPGFVPQQFNTSSTWSNMTGVAKSVSGGSTDMVNSVAEEAYSIGYVASPSASALGAKEAILYDEVTAVRTPPDVRTVSDTIARATIHPSRLTLSIGRGGDLYPFLGVTYYVFSLATNADCTERRNAVNFMHWTTKGDNAVRAAAEALFYAAIPSQFGGRIESVLRQATCRGELVIVDEAENISISVTMVIVLAITVCVVVALGLVVRTALFRDTKDTSAAPTDPNKPMTFVVIDIDQSTVLWARIPTSMGAALDTYNRIVHDAIKRHKGYEVRSVSEAYMVACTSAEQGLSIAIDVQRELADARWDPAINALYGELRREQDVTNDEGSPWNGPRVRIGLGTGSGVLVRGGSKGFHYSGPAVNTAASMEAAGPGGQILAPAETVAAGGGILDVRGAIPMDLGDFDVFGSDAAVQVYRIMPMELVGRKFATPDFGKRVDFEKFSKGAEEEADQRTTVGTLSAAPIVTDDDLGIKRVLRQGRRAHDPLEFLDFLMRPMDEATRAKTSKMFCKLWRIQYHPTNSAQSIYQLVDRVVETINVGKNASVAAGGMPSGAGGHRGSVPMHSLDLTSIPTNWDS